MYKVVANVEYKTSKGSTDVSIPTFFLNKLQLGIMNDEHAIRIAKDILNPTHDVNIIPYINVHEEDWYCID